MLFQEMNGVGHRKVTAERPVHNRLMPLMTDGEVEQVLHAYQARYQALRENPRVASILIFKNHGERAESSLEHPHSQLVATRIARMQMRREYEVAISHFDDTARCLSCDLVRAEVGTSKCLILETDRSGVFHPFASHVSFETWIAPKGHQPSCVRMARADLAGLARVVRGTLAALYLPS